MRRRDEQLESLAKRVIDCAYHLQNDLGPGLLESVYETVLAHRLSSGGLKIDRQVPVEIKVDGITFREGFRADLLIENRLLVELKSVEKLSRLHGKQVLTYLRLMDLPLGLLIHFGATTFRGGIKRVANDYQGFTP